MTPSIVRQDFLPGCRFSVATTVSAAKGKPKKQASLQENGTGRWPPFPLTQACASRAGNPPKFPGRRVIAGSGRRVTTALRSVVTRASRIMSCAMIVHATRKLAQRLPDVSPGALPIEGSLGSWRADAAAIVSKVSTGRPQTFQSAEAH
jgi:hypothetical protein